MTYRRMQAVRLLSIAEHLLMVVVQYQALPPAQPRSLSLSLSSASECRIATVCFRGMIIRMLSAL